MKTNKIKQMLAVVSAIALLAMPVAPVYAETDELDLEVVVTGGTQSLDVTSGDGGTDYTITLPGGAPTRSRVAFGHVATVSYFIANSFTLTAYTNDGDNNTAKTGIPGADGEVRLPLRIWSDKSFGLPKTAAGVTDTTRLGNPYSTVAPDGSILAGRSVVNIDVDVPDPMEQDLWSDQNLTDNGGKDQTLWAFLGEKNTKEEAPFDTEDYKVVLSSDLPRQEAVRDPNDATKMIKVSVGEPRIAPSGMKVYLAVDLLGQKAQAYKTNGNDGKLVFELLVR